MARGMIRPKHWVFIWAAVLLLAAMSLEPARAAAPASPPGVPADTLRKVTGQLVLKDGSMRFTDWDKCEAALRGANITVPVAVAPDGTIQAAGVPAGKFAFELRVTMPPAGLPVFAASAKPMTLGKASLNFEVPEIKPELRDQPLNLGKIGILVSSPVKVGAEVPDFAFKTMDGKEMRLKDFRGKVLLLDFWATWCGPCRREIPYIKAANEAYGARKDFAIISFSVDDGIEAPRSFVKKNDMPWFQAFLGNRAQDPVSKYLGVHSIPHMLLIGPDAKVLAVGLRGDKIKEGVGQALGVK